MEPTALHSSTVAVPARNLQRRAYAVPMPGPCSWQAQLATAAAVTEQPAVEGLLGNPALTAEQQASGLADICGDELGPEARNFLAILADNKRLPLLPEISAQFATFKANQ